MDEAQQGCCGFLDVKEANRMNWFDIFEAGTHVAADGSSHSYTQSDLDRIVAAYKPTIHEAPLVIGHPTSNAPAYGWVARLRRNGNRLQAQAKDVLPAFLQMVRDRRFPKRSISLYPDMTLRHIGFLGAMPPAIKGLKDIEFAGGEDYIMYMEENMTSDETATDAGEVSALKARIAELEALVEELRALIRANTDQEAQKEAEEFCESLVTQGKLSPAQRQKAINLVKQAKTADFSEAATIMEFLSALPAQVDFGEFAVRGDNSGVRLPARYKDVPTDAKRSAIYTKAREYMAHDKTLSFEQAVNKVLED
jgi:polyhydroxyalkanoate synthesis regulator phasin